MAAIYSGMNKSVLLPVFLTHFQASLKQAIIRAKNFHPAESDETLNKIFL
jgi:hypothetical protein